MRYSCRMRRSRGNTINVPVSIEGFNTAQSFVEGFFEHSSVSPTVATETMLVFEAVFNAVLLQDLSNDAVLRITAEDKLGGLFLTIGFEGKMFVPSQDNEGGASPELRIMEGYGDKISCSYHSGYNTIRISVKKSPKGHFIACGVGILLAIIVYVPISLCMDAEGQRALLEGCVFPLEELFANLMIIIGAPVTLFSLLKNASDTFIVAERTSQARRLQAISLVTSAVAVLLAVVLGVVFARVFGGWLGFEGGIGGRPASLSVTEVVSFLMPSSIVGILESASPIPLIIIALLVTYALCSAGKYFEMLKSAIDACFELFSQMLRAVMATLPFFCFVAILDVLLNIGFRAIGHIALLLVIAAICTCVLLATYAVRLRVRGIRVGEFTRELMPLLRENAAIGSVIEAVPYNIRYCAKHFGMNRKDLENSLPVLAQINLDGNCLLITLVAMLYIFASGMEVTWVNVVVIAVLVLFLSSGAPNQPGSILIGILFIVNYLDSYTMLGMAFYLEVFLGSVQNLINVTSSIVTVAELDRKS